MVVENKAERQSIGFQANRGSRVSIHTVCFVSHFTTAGGGGNSHTRLLRIREGVNGKKRFLSSIARMMGGGLPMPEFFGPLFRNAFLVNKKSLFLQKCQCIELLTVF